MTSPVVPMSAATVGIDGKKAADAIGARKAAKETRAA
jgi:hypothetical protein